MSVLVGSVLGANPLEKLVLFGSIERLDDYEFSQVFVYFAVFDCLEIKKNGRL
jgi:hypothetical protein